MKNVHIICFVPITSFTSSGFNTQPIVRKSFKEAYGIDDACNSAIKKILVIKHPHCMALSNVEDSVKRGAVNTEQTSSLLPPHTRS